MARKLTNRTPKKREQFLDALREGFSVCGAARAAGMSRTCAYEWRNADEEFARQWDEAIEEGTDGLEDIAKKEAKGGNTTLLIFLLKARRPDKYRERFEHSGPGGTQLNGPPIVIYLPAKGVPDAGNSG